jgi:thiol:disulfide interchange protein
LQLFPASQTAMASPGAADPANQPVWQPFNLAHLNQYRGEGRTVFVDFTASWCLSCQVNERVVLDRADVQQRLRKSGIVLMRADWTHHDEEIAQTLNKLGRSGVPTYVVYAPGAPPRILPEVLTPHIIFDMLDQLTHA